MLAGAYSNHYQTLEQEHINNLKEAVHNEVGNVLTRNKRLQHETNKRRRAQAIKRKLEAQREEKRRQEILAKRRDQIREATERFQRGNRTYKMRESNTAPYPGSGSMNNPVPDLERALRAVRGGSPHHQRSHTHDGSSVQFNYTAPVQQNGSNMGSGHNVSHHVPVNSRAQISKYASPKSSQSSNNRTHVHANEIAVRTELQHTSLRNLTNSRSLFEQQLEHHQNLLAEQERKSLYQFNEAIRKEMEQDRTLEGCVEDENPGLAHSESLSSVDSLEAGDALVESKSQAQVEGVVTNSGYPGTMSDANAQPSLIKNTSPTVGFHLHRNSGSPSQIAVVTPNNAHVNDATIFQSGSSSGASYPCQNGSNKEYASKTYPVNMQSAVADNGMTKIAYNTTPGPIPCTNAIVQHVSQHNVPFSGVYPMDTYKSSAPVPQVTKASTNHATAAAVTKVESPSVASTGGYYGHNEKGQSDPINADKYRTSNFGIHTKAWATPPPADGTTGASSASPLVVARENYAQSKLNATHVTNYKPHSIGTTATNVTVTSVYTNGVNTVSSVQSAVPPQSTAPTLSGPSNGLVGPIRRTEAFVDIPVQMTEEDSQLNTQEDSDVADAPSETGSESTILTQEDAESTPIPEKKVIKGILKKNSNPTRAALGPRHRIGGGANMVRTVGYVRGRSVEASVRDSLEVVRDHMAHNKAKGKTTPRKKSVRFADMICEEELSEGESEDTVEEARPPVTKQDKADKTPVKHKPPRPYSAKFTTNTPKVDPEVKEPRVASAGSLRRGPFLRTHPQNRPSSGRAHQRGGSGIPVPVGAHSNGQGDPSPQNGSGENAGGNQDDVKEKPPQPMYDENGVRLDRTPTDDEINWLWEKVRTCLNRESSTAGSTGNGAAVKAAIEANNCGYQPAQVAHKYIDGNTLASQFRVQTRISPGQNANNQVAGNGAKPSSNFTVVTPKKISMEQLGIYAQNRAALLNQRRQQQRKSFTTRGSSAQGVIHTTANQYHIPAQRNGATLPPNGLDAYEGDVSESMAAFLTAEMLSKKSMSDSQIEREMEAAKQRQGAYNSTKPIQKVSSALSIEEQRLLASLERLNERLRLNETNGWSQTTGAFVPRPPYGGRGFSGHRPLSSHRRTYSNPASGTRHVVRR